MRRPSPFGSEFNLLKEVRNPYSGEPVRWGSEAPGDVQVRSKGDTFILRVAWKREAPPQPVLYHHLSAPPLLVVYGEPSVGWYL